MTTQQKIARRKLTCLELTADLGPANRGLQPQQFYESRRNFQIPAMMAMSSGIVLRKRT